MVDPWDRVSDQLRGLAERLRSTYWETAAEAGPDEDEPEIALATLVEAWNRVASSLSVALGDAETREQLRRTAASFATAVGATISRLGEDLAGPERVGEQSRRDETDPG